MTTERTPDARVEAAARAWFVSEQEGTTAEVAEHYWTDDRAWVRRELAETHRTYREHATAALAAADAVQKEGLTERVAAVLDRMQHEHRHHQAEAVVAAIYGGRP